MTGTGVSEKQKETEKPQLHPGPGICKMHLKTTHFNHDHLPAFMRFNLKNGHICHYRLIWVHYVNTNMT